MHWCIGLGTRPKRLALKECTELSWTRISRASPRNSEHENHGTCMTHRRDGWGRCEHREKWQRSSDATWTSMTSLCPSTCAKDTAVSMKNCIINASRLRYPTSRLSPHLLYFCLKSFRATSRKTISNSSKIRFGILHDTQLLAVFDCVIIEETAWIKETPRRLEKFHQTDAMVKSQFSSHIFLSLHSLFLLVVSSQNFAE